MDNLLTSFKRRVMKRDLLLTCLVFVRSLEMFVEEKLQWPTTVTAILKSSRLNQKAFGFCRELFGFVVKKTLCDLPTCWCVNYVSWSLKREKEVKNDSLKRFFVRPNENWYFLNKKNKIKKEILSDPDVTWTRSLLIWSQTRYHCATESHAESAGEIYIFKLIKMIQYLYGLSIFHYQLTFDPVMGNLFSFVLTRNIRGKSVFCDYLKLLSTTTSCRWTRIEIWINFPFTKENKNVREMQRN